jgi:hypothetical protein
MKRETELFSIAPYVRCECGFMAYHDTQSCVQWCAHARECVGDEIYEQAIKNFNAAKAAKGETL